MQPQHALSINLTTTKEGKRLLCLLSASLASLLLFILSFSCRLPSPLPSRPRLKSNPPIPFREPSSASASATPPPPSLAYFISGSNGDGDRVLRLLHAVYHPKNRYLLHLDSSASQDQRERLALAVQSVPVFKAAGNVDVMESRIPSTPGDRRSSPRLSMGPPSCFGMRKRGIGSSTCQPQITR